MKNISVRMMLSAVPSFFGGLALAFALLYPFVFSPVASADESWCPPLAD